MDTFELNKFAGAILASLLLTMILYLVSESVFSYPRPAKPGYVIPVPAETAAAEGKREAAPAPAPSETAAADSDKEAAPALLPIEERLATADEKRGQADTKACQSCHSFEKGGAAKAGPPLYGVVGRAKGSAAGFEYSEAIKSKGKAWTYADLDLFLANPKAYAEGTKMAFAGESDPCKRADIIAYLRSLSENPEPLPAN